MLLQCATGEDDKSEVQWLKFFFPFVPHHRMHKYEEIKRKEQFIHQGLMNNPAVQAAGVALQFHGLVAIGF